MKRSKSQAVYKFLPGMWASEREDSGRAVTAEIKNWNYKKMENIYQNFIEGEIKRQIRLFESRNGDIRSFSLDERDSFLVVEPACNEGIPDIIGTVSPLLFYCSSCQRVFQKNSVSREGTHIWTCPYCKKVSVKQLQMVYTCECGYAQPIKKPAVSGASELFYRPNQNSYKMFYRWGNSERMKDLSIPCPDCQARLRPDNAESGRNYQPHSLKIINLVDKKSGDFFEKGEEAQKIIIAKWFEKLTQDQFREILDNVELAFSSSMRSDAQRREAEKSARSLIDAGMAPEEQFEMMVNTLLKGKSKGIDPYIAACDELFAKKKKENQELYRQWLQSYSYKLMQYDTIKYPRQSYSLKDVIEKQLALDFAGSREEIVQMNRKLGIANMQVSCDIEVISCAYGYTRKVADPKNNQNKRCRLKLNAYDRAKDSNARLVYGARLETEGILFEISQRRIVEWLFANRIISEVQLPDLEDSLSVKKWFAEYVKGEQISIFGEIEEAEKITKHVFALLHSMSHAFIKAAGELSGLSGNSLTEIILVETASIFIYAQTAQGVPLGALSGMAENNYMQFLHKVYTETRNCIFDPICADRDETSCSACLVLPEISCNHFNNELGRKYLYTIATPKQPLQGFWEM